MDYLDRLESKSIFIIREAANQFKNLALLWSIGKDSTVMLWLARKAFFGRLPFPVMHIDTTFKFPEMYAFRDRYAKQWNLNLLIEKNEAALKKGVSYKTHDAIHVSTELKTNALKQAIETHKFDAVFVGIRRDEHGIRAKERVFSPRDSNFTWDYKNQPPEIWDQYLIRQKDKEHLRIHPLLHWTETDIWEYIKRENIPTNKLYFSHNGKRYRSLGCMPITMPINSDADTVDKIIQEIKNSRTAERSGRAQDKEEANAMQKLRVLGYM